MLSQMIKTNAKTGEKNYSFWVDDVTSLLQGLIKFQIFS